MITVHSGWADDFSSLGLCPLQPTECTIEEHAGGMYQLKMTHPMDDTGRWWHLRNYNIIKAPAPMRETPLINMNQAANTTVVRRVYSVDVNSRLRLRTQPSTSTGKIIGRYKNGTKVVRIGESGSWYKVVVKSGGATGWMHSDYLEYVGEETQTITGKDTPGRIVEPRQTREQLFRITSVQRDDANRCVYITAQHVFYDLKGQLIKGRYEPKNTAAGAAAAAIFDNTIKSHDFDLYTDNDAKIDGEYTGRNVVSALLETDGIVIKSKARLVRDNFDVFLLKDDERDRGVEIRHGKNMTGAVLTEDVSEVATTIVPVGKDKEGEPLYLGGTGYVDAPNVGDLPMTAARQIEYDVRIGDGEGKFENAAKARAELERRANLEFEENGINHPTVGLEVDFVALENTRQYAQYAALQAVHLYDIVRVISARSGIDAKVRVTGYVYNCLRKRFDSITLGELFALDTTLSGYDISNGTLSGTKVIVGSLDGDRIREETIQYAHIAQAMIEQLNANAITALRAHINELVAGNITTDQLYADLAVIAAAQITTANIDKANINWADIKSLTAQVADITAATIKVGKIEWAEIETLNAAIANIADAKIKNATIHSAQIEDLTATVANIVSADIKTADIGYAQIKDLLAQQAIITDGVGGSLLIQRLAVTSANMLGATIGNLVLKSKDGKYYAIVIDTDGTIHTEEVTVTAGEIAAGQTSTGLQIVETTMNVRDLNAQNIKAQKAIIAEIFTSALTAGKITAGEAIIASAVIPELYVTTIRAIGESLELVNGRTNVIYRSETPPTNAGKNDLWIQPSTGAMYQMAVEDGLPDFYIDDAGILYYQYGKDQTVYALTLDENGDLYADENAPFIMNINLDGKIIAWERVKDGELQQAVNDNSELIREQSETITNMAGAIELRVTTEVYKQDAKATKDLIEKNESAISALEGSISSKVSKETYDTELGLVRGDISEIKQTATNIKLEVAKKTATFCQESTPGSFLEGDIWIKPGSGEVYEAVKNDSGTLEWQKSVLTPSQLKTSYIEIAQDHIDISTGGKLNVDSGAAHFRTKDYTLSILADDSSEETVLDFDASSKTLRVDEIVAGNSRPYISGITRVTSGDVGGLDGLAGMLANNQYEQIVYAQTTNDLSGEKIIIKGSNSLVVKITADDLTRVPPIEFRDITGNVYLENLKWSTNSTAVKANSGSIVMRDCYADSKIGLHALDHARISWIGRADDESGMSSAGACTTTAKAQNGAEIKLFGLIPKSNSIIEEKGGIVQSIDTFAFDGSSVDENITVSLPASVGYYGTYNGWHSGQLYQGYSNGKGRIYGCMKFEIPSGIGTVKNATLILQRYKSAGKGAEVDVNIYGSSTAFGSRPTLGTTVYVSREDAIDPGATVSFDVTAAAQDLVDGAIQQLVLYTGESSTMSGKVYSSQYARFDEATLKITY